jgi:hypothetical protein
MTLLFLRLRLGKRLPGLRAGPIAHKPGQKFNLLAAQSLVFPPRRQEFPERWTTLARIDV